MYIDFMKGEMAISDRCKLICLTAMVLAANSLDLISTRLASPDLANEWNVLQRTFNLGWIGLILAKLIGGGAAVYGYAYYLRHRKECFPKPGLDLSRFSRHLAMGSCTSLAPGIYSRSAWRRVGVNLGFFWAGMQLLVFWVAVDNVFLLYGILNPIRNISEMLYHLLQSALVASVVLRQFYLVNYREYLDDQLQPEEAARAAA